MRYVAMVLLSLGVIFGFGSGFVRLARHGAACSDWGAHHRLRHGEVGEWQGPARTPSVSQVPTTPATTPQTIVVQPAAPSPTAPIIVVVPTGLMPAPQPTVAPAPPSP